jgi:hypothetical protein
MGYGRDLPELPDDHVAELKRLLAGGGLSPDTRARCIAALIDADSAEKMWGVAESLRDETVSHFVGAADQLSARLRDFPGF